VAGFISGDGSFNVKISKSASTKLGTRVQLRLSVGLKLVDNKIIIALASFFKLGSSSDIDIKYIYYTSDSIHLQITNYSDIMYKIIPFFENYSIMGIKSIDLDDFKKVAKIIENQEHLTEEGFNKIISIKQGMNKGRL